MTLVLAELSLWVSVSSRPGIAKGLVSGGPQLGAGAAIGTGLAAGGRCGGWHGLPLVVRALCDRRAIAGDARRWQRRFERRNRGTYQRGLTGVPKRVLPLPRALRRAAAAFGSGQTGEPAAERFGGWANPIGHDDEARPNRSAGGPRQAMPFVLAPMVEWCFRQTFPKEIVTRPNVALTRTGRNAAKPDARTTKTDHSLSGQ